MKVIHVFNDDKLSSIEAVWGRDTINEYNRGLITTGVAVPSKKEADELPSSEEVRFNLASMMKSDLACFQSIKKALHSRTVSIHRHIWYTISV